MRSIAGERRATKSAKLDFLNKTGTLIKRDAKQEWQRRRRFVGFDSDCWIVLPIRAVPTARRSDCLFLQQTNILIHVLGDKVSRVMK
jgi:hypothetical protein